MQEVSFPLATSFLSCTYMHSHTLFYCTAIFAQTFTFQVFNRASRMQKDEQVSQEYCCIYVRVCIRVSAREKECTST